MYQLLVTLVGRVGSILYLVQVFSFLEKPSYLLSEKYLILNSFNKSFLTDTTVFSVYRLNIYIFQL